MSQLPIGQVARILELEDSDYKEKLQEMGCVKGVLVKTLMKAPFGDPIAYDIDDYTLSMRKKEASTIIVNPLGDLFDI